MRQRHYIKAWIEHSGLTLQQVADAIGKDKGTVSKVQNFRQAYTPETLEGIARAISSKLKVKVDAADLLMPPPSEDDPEATMRHLFSTLTGPQKLQAIRTLRAMFDAETSHGATRRKPSAA